MGYDVVGLGSCLVDYIALVPKIIGPEEKVNSAGLHIETGGPTANNLVQAARLGLKAAWLGKIGNDANGRMILDTFQRENMDISHVLVVPGKSSAFTWIPVDTKGDRCIYMFSNITKEISGHDVKQIYGEAICSSKAFHSEICQLPLEPVITGLEISKAAGVQTLIDLDVDTRIFIEQTRLGTQEELDRVLGLTNVLKASRRVALDMTGHTTINATIDSLLEKGPSLIVLTEGADGCILATQHETIAVPGYKVNVVDSTGAGDAFMGGLSYALLQDWPLERIGRFSNACGAICCMQIGAQQSGNLADVLHLVEIQSVQCTKL